MNAGQNIPETGSLSAEEVLSERNDPGVFTLLMRHPSIVWGGALLVVMVVIALFGPFFTADPIALNPTNRLKPPSVNNWFGTDFLGRDVFARVIYGARISLSIGLISIVLTFFLGVTIGGISGYVGGGIDNFIQRTIEVINSVPKLPL